LALAWPAADGAIDRMADELRFAPIRIGFYIVDGTLRR
jgi:hypothetical protein